jgi:hypothetical protein
MLSLSKEKISQIVTDKIIAGGSMFGPAALLVNRGQVAYIAQQIAEAIKESENELETKKRFTAQQ